MSTTYYCYREKYFYRGAEDAGGKGKIFLANWIEKQVACSSKLSVEPCYSMQREQRACSAKGCSARCIALDPSEAIT
jgi:hypothetical protein